MKRSISAEDVLSEIEFELVQGTISRDELGQSVQAVRKYQNKLRGEILEGMSSKGNNREAMSRLLQINDMLLTLLQEMTTRIQSLQLELRKTHRVQQRLSAAGTAISEPGTGAGSGQWDPLVGDRPEQLFTGQLTLHGPDEGLDYVSPTEVEDAMYSDALRVSLDVRPTNVPFIGGLVRRWRVALHNLTVFYVNRLATQQSPINQTYGDWILRLIRLYQDQQAQIEAVSQQLEIRQATRTHNGSTSPRDAAGERQTQE